MNAQSVVFPEIGIRVVSRSLSTPTFIADEAVELALDVWKVDMRNVMKAARFGTSQSQSFNVSMKPM